MSLGNKFDQFLTGHITSYFNPDIYGDQENETFKSEAIDVERSRLRSSTANIENCEKYKGRKVSRKELFEENGLDSDSEINVDVNNENTDKESKLTDKERASRLEEYFNKKVAFGLIKKDKDNTKIKADEEEDEDVESEEEKRDGDLQKNIVLTKNKFKKNENIKVNQPKIENGQLECTEDDEEEYEDMETDEQEQDVDESSGDEEKELSNDSEEEKASSGENKNEMDIKNLKGTNEAISKQYALFDALIDLRLSQQEMLFQANQLPQVNDHTLFRNALGTPFEKLANKITEHYGGMLKDIVNFGDVLLKHTRGSSSKSKSGLRDDKLEVDLDQEITSEEDDDDDDDEEEEDTKGTSKKKKVPTATLR